MSSAADRASATRAAPERKAQPGGRGREPTPPAVEGTDPSRRDQIRAAAARQFARNGVLATTVRDIAKETGILSGSLYHHFDSKETMVDEILSAFVDELVETDKRIVAESPTPTATVESLVRAVVGLIEEHPHAPRILQNDSEYLQQFPRFAYLRRTEREIRAIWTGVLERGMADGSFRDDLPVDFMYRFIRDSTTMIPRWYEEGGRYSLEDVSDMWITMILGGIRASGRRRVSGRKTAR